MKLNTIMGKTDHDIVKLNVGSYYKDSIFKSEAGSILVGCLQNLLLDLSKSLIFFSRQVTLLREKSRAM